MTTTRIKLEGIQRKWFDKAMETIGKNLHNVSNFDNRLYRDLKDAHDMFGYDMEITVKQIEHIKMVAMEIETGRYGDDF